ncbi:MAG: hypothetical protein M3Y54_13775 [Bacteroidota bacterium]|nr:hypothetical protein [Bacteroidota bacterium]
MISITKEGMSLVVPLENLQDLLFVQMSIAGAIEEECYSDERRHQMITPALLRVLRASLFNEEQMDAIEAMFKEKAGKPKARAAA